MKNVFMLTTFLDKLDSYSMVQLAEQQLKMLNKYGYPVTFIHRGGAGWENSRAKEIRLIPDYIVDNDGNYTGIEERAGKPLSMLILETYKALETVLEGAEVIITHDLIYQPSNLIQDAAAAMYSQKHPDVQWLHWVHSATSPRLLGKVQIQKYRNAKIIYPNAWDVPRVARNFGYEESSIIVVPHPMDYAEFFKWHPLTQRLVEEKGLLRADVIGCYPLRLDRGKQPDIVLEIFTQLRKLHNTIRLVIIDFQSSGGDKVTFRKEMKQWAANNAWHPFELTFMSEFDASCEIQTPKEVVRDLMLLSDVYIHPSRSETYSLTTQEARACRNVLVLNDDFPPMRSVYGSGPIYRKFSGNVDVISCQDGELNTTYHDRDGYMRDTAKIILNRLNNEAVCSMSRETRKNKNIDTVFCNYIIPLIEGGN